MSPKAKRIALIRRMLKDATRELRVDKSPPAIAARVIRRTVRSILSGGWG